MRNAAPEKYHDILVPKFELGCKRRTFDSGYLESLHLPNITLTNEPAVEVLENGVRMRSGEVVEADVHRSWMGWRSLAVAERLCSSTWKAFVGPEAYNFAALSGFPNFFLLLGPNTTNGSYFSSNGYRCALSVRCLRGRRPLLTLSVRPRRLMTRNIQNLPYRFAATALLAIVAVFRPPGSELPIIALLQSVGSATGLLSR
ncbi:hypothetical protein B0H67DRAFT_568259 [Lasiosphaeris hirsuta]|uniref:Uncharacterized protein n=1 Tax=Lasiosphaeris hirsuta TaxID=260670 RepID=A0AA40E6T6_9PEZI|nr:hypothetical protein B0H67DRAFT_568259 [Lasiosphaeris hirsuta]